MRKLRTLSEKSLQLAPNNFDTRKIQISILLGEHEFPAALDAAKALNKQFLTTSWSMAC